jgi:hypothetical protein
MPCEMNSEKENGKKMKTQGAETVCAMIGFPTDPCRNLEETARQEKVSTAQVVRVAAEKYLADKWPFFGGQEKGRIAS